MRSLGIGPIVALAALAGCATATEGAPGPAPASISYETGPCFGACPVYRVTVSADGRGVFEGRRFTAVEGERPFRIAPDRFRALVAHLEPIRPAGAEMRYSGDACEAMATDLPSAEVTWDMPAGRQQLYFYHGCDMEKNRAIAERLDAVPSLLPIAELISQDD
ncbi:MAG TPA: DUF6438 domain-containing protein [Allosphingosinicella sp.]|nr:DUF6438 domain-containing protein [Allosphingosinicella sp.]